ncbi:hypothetical protein ABT023_26910 [Micromonospora sp. NPDC002296]|uniref:hypothetical protein n=1 Tax=Micromonospora sp. NPDC002296 TaxID=3154271 RepID=UPI003318FDBC
MPLFIIQETKPALRLLDWPGLYCAAVTAAMVVHLAGRVSSRPSRTLPWSLALTLLAATTIALRTVTLLDYSDQAQDTTLATIASVQVIAVLAVGVPLAVLAARALRRLPPIPAAAPRPTTAAE